ncbi:hypothetical protein [Streptomyces sp. NBC_00582]|uniref:hypothetical protein n=1 Tax=Streptomyces sp. NBC_00582 TaxID=2975783 RepID=UPI001064215A|nr:hypothetical protein [Streptomyces sp. NBC_00582]WUB65982.1 hypothetical protein OG852_38975 [Streptomyces sp. NBC_00582]
MRSMVKLAATTASVLLAGIAIATPAQAAADSKHTGRSGCFNWSWADGISTTTVYFHNICDHKATINIWWKDGAVEYMKAATVAADGKGNLKHTGDVKSIDG